MTNAPEWNDRDEVDAALVARAVSRFTDLFGAGDMRVAAAPGRVNLIGDHTDYNDGFVLPMAIDRHVTVAFRARSDRRLRVHAMRFDQTREVDLEGLAPFTEREWIVYVAGVAWALAQTGHLVPGADLVIDSTVPVGSGLSSSAALEMAVARALAELGEIEWNPARMALVGHRAENGFVGIKSGVMDQFASACGQRGRALLLDCRSLETREVTVPADLAVVVMDTGVRRALVGSAYNERRASCDAAVAAVRTLAPEVAALRDVDAALLDRAAPLLDAVTLRRARHVVAENMRPVQMADALESGDAVRAGALMNESHESLRDLYEVSCEELDRIAELAREQEACFGARMTGAGFGGCAVALVRAGEAESFATEVARRYNEWSGLDGPVGEAFVVRAVQGAHLLAEV